MRLVTETPITYDLNSVHSENYQSLISNIQVKDAEVVSALNQCTVETPSTQLTTQPTPKPYTNQPATPSLLKSIPTRIRNRVSSLDPDPLPHHWTHAPNTRYWISDPIAYACIGVANIPWLVTTGVLVETDQGLRWAGGQYTYLLWRLQDDDEGVEGKEGKGGEEGRIIQITADDVRRMQRERWDKEMAKPGLGEGDRPAIPIVEVEDPMWFE